MRTGRSGKAGLTITLPSSPRTYTPMLPPSLTPHSCPTSPRKTTAPTSNFTSRAVSGRLREFMSKPKEKISPELAAEVVRTYLLPLFVADDRQATDKARMSAFGLSPRYSPDASVYSELKLSAALLRELEACRTELKASQTQVKDAVEAKVSAEAELKCYQERILELEKRVTFLNQLSVDEVNLAQSKALETALLSGQLHQLTSLYSATEEKSKEYSLLLHQERSKNDIR